MPTDQEKRDYIRRKVAEELRYHNESIASIAQKTWREIQKLARKIAKKLKVAHDLIVDAFRELGANI